MVSFIKCVSWSLVRFFGHPNIEFIFLKKNLTAMSVVQSLTGVAFAHIVRYSIAIIMYLMRDCLASGVMGPMKSIALFSKICTV